MQITDWPEQNLLGLLYLIVLLLCCFGSGPKWVWAPVEALSAISLVSQYLVGVKAIQGWLFPAGCYGPHPTPGCNAIWAGLFASNDDPSWWDDWSGPRFVSYAIGEAKADFVRAQAARSLRLIPFMALQVSAILAQFCAILRNSSYPPPPAAGPLFAPEATRAIPRGRPLQGGSPPEAAGARGDGGGVSEVRARRV
jgi:hypothetical protein